MWSIKYFQRNYIDCNTEKQGDRKLIIDVKEWEWQNKKPNTLLKEVGKRVQNQEITSDLPTHGTTEQCHILFLYEGYTLFYDLFLLKHL